MIQVAPSILSADFLRLGDEIAALQQAGADLIHVDVMDGHFVPNLTLGPPIIKAIKRVLTVPLDVHLMIENADQVIDDYVDAGADVITIHAEGVVHLERAIHKIKSHSVQAGVALNPSTHESALKYVIGELDTVLIMSVNPGFGGQKFLPSALIKIAAVKEMLVNCKNSSCVISVDGGINETTGRECVKEGATRLVAGSYILGSKDYAVAIKNLKSR